MMANLEATFTQAHPLSRTKGVLPTAPVKPFTALVVKHLEAARLLNTENMCDDGCRRERYKSWP